MPMRHFLYQLQPTRPEMLSDGLTSAEETVVGQHFAYLQELTQRGIVLLAGRTAGADPGGFGIVIFRAESDEQAREIMAADPAVAGSVMRAELYPYRVAVYNAEALQLDDQRAS